MVQVVFAFNHRQLFEHRRVFPVERLHVDVVASDGDKREEENVAVN